MPRPPKGMKIPHLSTSNGKSRLAIRVLNYCRPRVNGLNDIRKSDNQTSECVSQAGDGQISLVLWLSQVQLANQLMIFTEPALASAVCTTTATVHCG